MNRTLLAVAGPLYLVVLLVVGCSSSATPGPTQVQSGKPSASSPAAGSLSFAGKTVTIVPAVAAGGGTDLAARVYAKYLAKLLPGTPTVVVRNMPGAAGTIGANFAYAAKPDGLTLAANSGQATMSFIMGLSGVKYDLSKMPVIFSTSQAYYWYAKAGLVTKAEDLPRTKGIIYGSSPAGHSYILALFMKLMDIRPDKFVVAYSGGAESRRALYAGEINLTNENTVAYFMSTAQLAAKGEVVPLFQSGVDDEKGNLVRDAALTVDIPTVEAVYRSVYGKAPSGITWQAIRLVISSTSTYSEMLSLPPEAPDAITKLYWDVAQKMLDNPEFQKELTALTAPNIVRRSGEANSKAFIKQMTSPDPKIISEIKTVLEGYGIVLS
ncbi:MAG: hypothetical protein HYX90_06195 [Chloroflexi bacterium]|nr:hypothetical protein [Chloroflexota bacterium]